MQQMNHLIKRTFTYCMSYTVNSKLIGNCYFNNNNKHFLVSNNLGIDQERVNISSGLNNK